MRIKTAILAAAVAMSATVAVGEMTIEQQKTWAKIRDREMLLSRERVSIDNEWYIVEHWQNPGRDKQEWMTNKVFKVTGRKQDTSWSKVKAELEDALAVAEVDAGKARKVEQAAQKARKKDAKNFAKWISDTEKARSKSSDDMKDFYDAILEMSTEAREEL